MNSLQVVDSVRNAQPGKLRHNEHSTYDDGSTHSTKIPSDWHSCRQEAARFTACRQGRWDGVFASVSPLNVFLWQAPG